MINTTQDINWAIEHPVIRMHPEEYVTYLRLGMPGLEISHEILCLRATWTAPDGTDMEAVWYNEFVPKAHGDVQPTLVFAIAVKPVASDMSGYYTRVGLPDGSMYRYPAGANPLESPIQVFDPGRGEWGPERPPLMPDEYEKLYVLPALV
jgi:hypothetical protein